METGSRRSIGSTEMSYEVKLDEMVGKHVAEFQAELTLARQMGGLDSTPPMPYGYPVQLYHPHHTVLRPHATRLIPRSHGKLSNEVPWVLALEVVDNQILGVYNPQIVNKAA